jgi:hypothetical protein
MLFKAFFFMCVVAVAMGATTLDLNNSLKGSLVDGQQDYTFSYSHTGNTDYQLIYVLPDLTAADTPQVVIQKTTGGTSASASCSASATSNDGQVRCAYAFQGCVRTPNPEDYTISVKAPALDINGKANINFTIGAISVSAALSAAVSETPTITTCCGFSGASWHYVGATPTQTVNSVSLNLQGGSLTSGSLNVGSLISSFVPPGIFIIPDFQACTNLTLASIIANAKSLTQLAKASLSFATNLSFDSANPSANKLTINIDSKVALPGVSYWVLVVPNADSSADYKLSVDISSTPASSASTLSGPLASLF